VRDDYSTWSNKSVWPLEISLPQVADEVVSKVRAVSQIKHLKEHGYRRALPDLEVLANPRIELEKRLATQIVKGSDETLA